MYSMDEGESGVYTAALTDENGTAIAAANLSAFTLTLYEKSTETVINSRNAQNVLNTNNVTVDAAGVVTWTIQPGDTAIIRPDAHYEDHVGVFVATWAAGTKRKPHEVTIRVHNLAKQP